MRGFECHQLGNVVGMICGEHLLELSQAVHGCLDDEQRLRLVLDPPLPAVDAPDLGEIAACRDSALDELARELACPLHGMGDENDPGLHGPMLAAGE